MTDVPAKSTPRWLPEDSERRTRTAGMPNGRRSALPAERLAGDGPNHLPVRFQPVLPLSVVFSGTPTLAGQPYPLNQPGVTLTYSGTAAIYQAFHGLGLPAGSTVLCPSYNCGHELEPLLRLGLRIDCYRVTTGLTMDLEDIERRMTSDVRAILVTHFFGFGQPLEAVRALCDRYGIVLVEDCAHAFLSDNVNGNLGRVGDAAIYSIRKSLPLPNGGAVVFNSRSVKLPEHLEAPPMLTTWFKALDLAKKSALDEFGRKRSLNNLVPLGALTPLVAGSDFLQRLSPAALTAFYDPDDENFNFSSDIMNWGMSPFSRGLLDRIEWRHIAARRLYNYRFLVDALDGVAGCEFIRPEVPDCTAPLFLPILTNRRQEVFRYLLRHKIFPAIWWDQQHPAVQWEQFPEARDLKNRVLALPVHQDVDQAQLNYLADTLRRCPLL